MTAPGPQILRRKRAPTALRSGPRPTRALVPATHRITLPTVAALLALAAFGCGAEHTGDEAGADPPRRRAVATRTSTAVDDGANAGDAGSGGTDGAIAPTPMPLPGEAAIVVPVPPPAPSATIGKVAPKPPPTTLVGAPPPVPHMVKGAMPLVHPPHTGDPLY